MLGPVDRTEELATQEESEVGPDERTAEFATLEESAVLEGLVAKEKSDVFSVG